MSYSERERVIAIVEGPPKLLSPHFTKALGQGEKIHIWVGSRCHPKHAAMFPDIETREA